MLCDFVYCGLCFCLCVGVVLLCLLMFSYVFVGVCCCFLLIGDVRCCLLLRVVNHVCCTSCLFLCLLFVVCWFYLLFVVRFALCDVF